MEKRDKLVYALLALLCAAHYAVGYFAPKAPSPYQFSALVTALLTISITIPFYAAWFAGLYAGLTLRSAVRTMREHEDKTAFSRISTGVFLLTAFLIASSMVTAPRPYFPDNRAVLAFITIVSNYLYTLGPLIGFYFLSSGSAHLRRPMTGGSSPLVALLGAVTFAAYGAAYLWLLFTNPTRQVGTATVLPTYYLPDALIVMTLVLPFFVSLGLSLVAIYRMVQYFHGVSGLIYKRSALNFIVGMLFVLGGSVFLQGILSLGSSRLAGLGLGAILVIVYAFLGLTTFGYLSLALGARKLAIIERVMQKYEANG
jgi:hypothetical protein